MFSDNLDNHCLFCLCVTGRGTVRDSLTRDDLEWPEPKISSTICLIIWTSFRTWIPISSFMTTIHCFECWYPSKNIKWVIFFLVWNVNVKPYWQILENWFRIFPKIQFFAAWHWWISWIFRLENSSIFSIISGHELDRFLGN